MKRFISMFICLALLLTLFSACGTQEENSSEDSTTSSSKTTDSSEEEDDDEEDKDDSDKDDETTVWNYFDGYSSVFINSASEFHHERAWIVASYNMNDDSTRYAHFLINKKGKIVYDINSTDYSNISHTEIGTNDVAIVSYTGESGSDQILIDKDGKKLWSLQDDGWAAADKYFGEGTVEGVSFGAGSSSISFSSSKSGLFSGYSVCSMDVNTYDVSGNAYGVVGPDGSWVMKPKIYSNFGLVRDFPVAWYDNDDNDRVYVNLETGDKTTDYKTAQGWENSKFCDQHSGLMYDSAQNGYVNKNGKLVIDLAKYDFGIWGGPSEFSSNGYAVLGIKNDAGDPYYTVIDTSGNETFAPMKNPYSDESGNAYYKWFIMGNDQTENLFYTSVSGEIMEIEGFSTIYNFTEDGFAVVKDKNGHYHYIDESGERAFKF